MIPSHIHKLIRESTAIIQGTGLRLDIRPLKGIDSYTFKVITSEGEKTFTEETLKAFIQGFKYSLQVKK